MFLEEPGRQSACPGLWGALGLPDLRFGTASSRTAVGRVAALERRSGRYCYADCGTDIRDLGDLIRPADQRDRSGIESGWRHRVGGMAAISLLGHDPTLV
jgi:hypothetical protein